MRRFFIATLLASIAFAPAAFAALVAQLCYPPADAQPWHGGPDID